MDNAPMGDDRAADTPTVCERCDASFFYDPKHHRCEGEWEAIATPLPKVEPKSWVDECMERQW